LNNSDGLVIQNACQLLQRAYNQNLQAKDDGKSQLNTDFDELLRICVALATSFPQDLVFLNPQNLQWCLYLLENETHTSKDHLTMSGIFLAQTLRAKKGEDWLGMLLSDFKIADSTKLVFPQSLSLPQLSFISLLKGILQAYPPSSVEFTYCLVYQGTDCTVREALFMKLCQICSESSEAICRLLGFTALAVWFQTLAKNSEHKSFASEKDIQVALNFIFDEWDDPIDAIPHILRDTFLAIIDIIKDNKDSMALITNRIQESEDSKKVKFDLLTHVITKMGVSYLLRVYPTFVDDAFQTLESVPNPVRVVSFITGFLKSCFKEFNPKNIGDAQEDVISFYHDKWWTSKLTQALLSEKHSVRKIMADSVLPAIFKARGDAFDKLSRGTVLI
jgi:hypothetical protein